MEAAAAYSFVRRVRSHPQLYCHFRRVITGYGTGKLDVPAVVSELGTLFQSHPDLLDACRIFLPPQIQGHFPMPRRFRKSNVISADMNKLKPCIDFMNKVQKRFGEERAIIRAYLETLRKLTKGELSNTEAYDAVARIFGGKNQDLVNEFETLLDDDAGVEKETKKEEDLDLLNRMEDEMIELDIRFSLVTTTLRSARELMKILRDSAENQKINIDKYFSAVSLGCIWEEYEKQGFLKIKQLRKDPKRVLPSILKKLEAKETELKKKLQNRWSEIRWQKHNSITISDNPIQVYTSKLPINF